MENQLLVIEKLELVPFFTKGDQLDDTLEKIEAEAMAHVPDVSTLKGRNAIKANVTKVTKSKVYLEGHGKDLSAEYKAIPKIIDANRKKSRDFFAALVDKIREPLTAWEAIDKAEKAQIIDTAAFLIEYELQHEDGLRDNELIDLKAVQAEVDRKAEIETARIEAAAKATAETELKAAAKIKQAQLDTAAAEQRETEAKQATKDAEWLTYIAEAYEINAKIDFDRQVAITEEEARKRQEMAKWVGYISEAYAYNDQLIATKNAQVAEAQRQKDIADKQKRDQAAREADENHRGAINRQAMKDFISCGMSKDSAVLAVKALVAGKISNAGINY